MTGMWVWIGLAAVSLGFAVAAPFTRESRGWCVVMAITVGLGAGLSAGISLLLSEVAS